MTEDRAILDIIMLSGGSHYACCLAQDQCNFALC